VTKTRKRTSTKRKKSTRRKVATEQDLQLAMYHMPFARTTKQPKIPDGKLTESLGLSHQAVREIQVNSSTNFGSTDVTHIMLFAGQNCSCLVLDDEAAGYVGLDTGAAQWTTNPEAGRVHAIGFNGANNLDCTTIATTASTGSIVASEQYAFWRTVSCALKLSLLNNDEENEGWWEAVRVHRNYNSDEFLLTETDDNASSEVHALVPYIQTATMAIHNIVNENSYSTGLLKELHNHTFKLNPMRDEHTPAWQYEAFRPEGWLSEVRRSDTPGATEGWYIALTSGYPAFKSLVESTIDTNFDMIYIRIHGRNSVGGTLQSSKLHLNVVSNQEVVFEPTEAESRFHTSTFHASNMDDHIRAAKIFSNASIVN